MKNYQPIPGSNLQARVEIYYNKGSNEAWNRSARGYYLSVQPVEIIKVNPAGYELERSDPRHGVKLLLIETTRKTVKGYNAAVKIAAPQIDELITYIKNNKL
jgi:hypothetical protein